MDVFDRARENDELFRDNALKEHFRKRNSLLRGSSGICEDCNEPIPVKRLKANPGATRCVDCQSKYERGGHNDT